MDIEALRNEKQRLNNRLSWIDGVISTYVDGRRDEMGLVEDEVKTPTYSALKRERAIIFEELRQFNGKYAKTLHKA